jgi:hypothetical protein
MKFPSIESTQVALSVVSHGRIGLICSSLEDFRKLDLSSTSIALTTNIPEDLFVLSTFSDLPISLIQNKQSKDFGENHNAAF